MTQLIVYINSEQKASAFYDNCYISFHGARYESNLTEFAKTVLDEFRVKALSEIKEGISILVVSNGGTNKTVRTIINNLLHTDEEDRILNVDVQELNVIESKYFLPMLGNPENPEAEDYAQFFEIEKSSMVNTFELEELKNEISTLKKELENKNSEISELKNEKSVLTKKIDLFEKKKETEELEKKNYEKELELSKSIYKIDFLKNAEESGIVLSVPKGQTVTFSKKFKNGEMVSKGSVIATYYTGSRFSSGEVSIFALKTGRIYYMVNDNANVKNCDVIAVIGEENWTKDDAIFFLKKSSEPETEKKNECEPVIIKADIIKDFKSDSPISPNFDRHLSDELEELNGVEYEKDKTINGIIVEKNQVLFRIKENFSHSEFIIKAPCSGKIFFLVQTKGSFINTSVKADTSLAIIVPESWSKSQAIEWYRSVEPLEEPYDLSFDSIIDYYTVTVNTFPEDAYVLPDDEYVKFTYYNGEENNKYSKKYCCVAGKIRYENGHKMNQGYKHTGGVIARIY